MSLLGWERGSFRKLQEAERRGGNRHLLALRASFELSVRNRELCLVAWRGDRWVQRYSALTLVSPSLYLHPPQRIDALLQRTALRAGRPRNGGTVVDVGAGIGTELVAYSRLVGPHGKVFAIEAHPHTAQCAADCIRRNRLRNVELVQVAVSGSAGEVMMTDDEAHGGNRLMQGVGSADAGAAREGGVVRVRCVPLDSLYEQWGLLGRLDRAFVKMNIEGSEVAALHGSSRFGGEVGHYAVSCHDFLAADAGDDSLRTKSAVSAWLEQRGFRVSTAEDDGLDFVRDYVYGERPDA